MSKFYFFSRAHLDGPIIGQSGAKIKNEILFKYPAHMADEERELKYSQKSMVF